MLDAIDVPTFTSTSTPKDHFFSNADVDLSVPQGTRRAHDLYPHAMRGTSLT